MAALGKLRTIEGDRLGFWCPGCEKMHVIHYGNGGWGWNRSGDQPTFTPSILVRFYKATPEGEAMMDRRDPLPPGMDRYPGRDEVCHSFVTDGRIQFLGDCTHKLAGQTVELPMYPYHES